MAVRLQGRDVDWLGYIAWYSVSADVDGVSTVTLKQLTAWAEDLGVELVTLPTPRSADAFRTATTGASERWNAGPGLQQELITRQVQSTDDVLVRHILLVTTDSRQQVVESVKAAEVKFYRPTRLETGRRPGSESVRHRLAPDLPDDVRQRAEVLIERMSESYKLRTQFIMVGTLRKVVRDLLDARLEALPLRAGVYFVPGHHAEQLPRVAQLVSRFGPQAFMHYLPLVDDPAQRTMLADAIATECADLASGARNAADQGKLTGLRHARLLQRLPILTERARYYSQLLGTERMTTHVALAEAKEILTADQRKRRSNFDSAQVATRPV